MLRYLLSACALLSTACTPVATNAVVARTYKNNFQSCTISIGWTVDQLLEACGEPDSIVTTANKTAECFVYSTDAVVFVTGQGAPVIAACAESRADAMRSAKGKDYRRIISVTGLRSIPGRPVSVPASGPATVGSP